MINAIYSIILGLQYIEVKPIVVQPINKVEPHIPNHYKGRNKSVNYNRLTNK